MKKLIIFLLLPLGTLGQPFSQKEIAQWKKQASSITIFRDEWGIPHVYGKTDADAVFGLLYAQCEDDFKRVEMNYIEKLGRLSELKGPSALYADLTIRLLIDTLEAKSDYAKAPPYLKKLLNAYADGVNYYLHTHPLVKPALLNRFEPWFPLLWTDGSIGAISTGGVSEEELKNFYGKSSDVTYQPPFKEEEGLTGSNGFAFSPSITASGNAMLYINPHVTLYFRPEVHMSSEEGLNTYGAVTWGQLFIYQGFNEHCGWMHTSSAVDVGDMYAEKISADKKFYTYEGRQKKLTTKEIGIQYLENRKLLTKTFTTYHTHHGPIMAQRNGQWISVRSHNRSMKALEQSWLRTKARSFAEFKKIMNMRENTSNNTVYADAEGNIAYWHGNFIPKRNTTYNWSKPVDGSTAATEWKGLHTVDEGVHVYNPPNGWLQNCNSTPFSVAGPNSPLKKSYPSYMAPDPENFRGINAVSVLAREKQYTLDKVIDAGYDRYLTAFEKLVPALIKAYDNVRFDTIFPHLDSAMVILKQWDLKVDTGSVALTLTIEWGQKILPKIMKTDNEEDDWGQVEKTSAFIAKADGYRDLIYPLLSVLDGLKSKYGTWQVRWGDINRFQRISSDIDPTFSDDQPSIPVPFVGSAWGMLPSYNTRYFPGTKKRYGVHGNSFVCAVEFGKRVTARSLLAGGESGDPASPHFSDQAALYSSGHFKKVWFYMEDVVNHAKKSYHPGE